GARRRVWMLSGGWRVTTTGVFWRLARGPPSPPRAPCKRGGGPCFQVSLTAVPDTGLPYAGWDPSVTDRRVKTKACTRGRRGPPTRANRYPMSFFRRREPMNSKRTRQIVRRASVMALALIAALTCAAAAARAAGELATGPKSGLPMPRFVSLKPDRVNVRGGPTRDHEVTFVYTRAGLPVEITAESDNWRRIRDWEGSEGWVYHS